MNGLFDMVGPASGPNRSQTADMVLIGSTVRRFLTAPVRAVDIRFPQRLFPCFLAQNNHAALMGGILGLSPGDPDLRRAPVLSQEKGIQLSYSIFRGPSPAFGRAVKVTVEMAGGKVRSVLAAAENGGIAISEIDGFELNPQPFEGHLFVWSDTDVSSELKAVVPHSKINITIKNGFYLYDVRPGSDPPPQAGLMKQLLAVEGVTEAAYLEPLLPAGKPEPPPLFSSFGELAALSEKTGKDASELAVDYEAGRTGRGRQEIWTQMSGCLETMKRAASAQETPVSGCLSALRPLGLQAAENGPASGANTLTRAMAVALGIMEHALSLGDVIAAPTGRSAGIVPACLLSLQEALSFPDEQIIRALFVCAASGVILARHGFGSGGGEDGFRREAAVAGAMASAGMTWLMGGDARRIAASAALLLKDRRGAGLPGCGCACDYAGECLFGVSGAFAAAHMAAAGLGLGGDPDGIVQKCARLDSEAFPLNAAGPPGEGGYCSLSRDIPLPRRTW